MADVPRVEGSALGSDDVVTGSSAIERTVPPSARSAAQLDDYRLIRRIAEGGMGEVHEAEQVRPVHRTVAIKLMKFSLGSRDMAARFAAERQALARMAHPNIAQIFDAGTTRDGQPFFSMEFVSGVPITDYCDTHALDIPERIRLFLQVCEGVNHAHQKGVIHRDIKPSNVLVAEQDGRPTPKVIDFGLAKAISTDDMDLLGTTVVGQVLGTPAYMSPEQISLDASNIDTRTDVYALGMLLYRLLAGQLPFDVAPSEKFDELRARIREQPAPAPSALVAAAGKEAARVAETRRTTVEGLAKQLRGDLDWIVLRALEKDRDRRYGTAAALASDLERHLSHEPVLAGPPSRRYRLVKFIRRHRVGVAAAAAVLTALLTGTTLAVLGLMRALGAEAEARLEAATANRVTDFLIESFRVSDPSEARGNSLTARELLDSAAARIRTDLADDPVLRGRLSYQMSRVYQALGLYPAASELIDLSLADLDELEEVFGADARTHNALLERARVSLRMGRTDESLDFARRALVSAERLLGPSHPDVAGALMLVGQLRRDTGDYAEAQPLLERALDIFETAGDEENAAWVLLHLGWLHQRKAEYRAAVPVYERAVALASTHFAEGDPNLGYFLNDAAVLQSNLGNHRESEQLHRRVLEIRERTLEPDHPAVAESLQNIGTQLWFQGRYAEIRPFWERTVEIRRARLGPNHPAVASGLGNLALLSRALGAFEDAREKYEQSLNILEAAHGPDHLEVAHTLMNLGNLQARTGEFDDARVSLERALAIRERVLGSDHPDVADVLDQVSFRHLRMNNHEAAADVLDRIVAIRERTLGPGHPDVLVARQKRAVIRRSVGELERVVETLEGTGDARLASSLVTLAWLVEDRAREKSVLDRARALFDEMGDDRALDQILQHVRADAVENSTELALYRLRQADALGYGVDGLADDPVFDALRGSGEFRRLAAALASRVR